MNRALIVGAALIVGVLATLFVASMPTQVDDWDCGGRIGRVATIGPFHSTGGEPGASTDDGPSDSTCTNHARVYLAAGSLGGLLIGGGIGSTASIIARRRANAI